MIKQLASGLIMGILVPIIGIFFIPIIFNPNFEFSEIATNFWMNSSFTPTIQLSMILNLIVFFILNKVNRELMARGVIAGTIVWGIYLFILVFGK